MCYHRHPQPCPVRSEPSTRHHSCSEFVLDHVVDRFDRACFLPMPVDQFLKSPVPYVSDDRKVLDRTPISEQLPLTRAHSDSHVTQRLAVFVFSFVVGYEHHLRAFTYHRCVPAVEPLPALFFPRRAYCLAQRRVHTRADCKAYEPTRTALT